MQRGLDRGAGLQDGLRQVEGLTLCSRCFLPVRQVQTFVHSCVHRHRSHDCMQTHSLSAGRYFMMMTALISCDKKEEINLESVVVNYLHWSLNRKRISDQSDVWSSHSFFYKKPTHKTTDVFVFSAQMTECVQPRAVLCNPSHWQLYSTLIC